jgi:beta-lactamase class A
MAAAVVAVAAQVGAACAPAEEQLADPVPLEERVAARLDSLDAISTLYAKHLPTGREIAVRADRPMNTLSVIKVPIMVQAFRDAEAGRLNLDERYRIRPQDFRRGSGLLQTFTPGLEPTYRDLIMQMIITSDNTATDIMIARVGLDRVNALLTDLGYTETRLRMTTGDLFRTVWELADSSHASLSHREVYERGFPSDTGAAARSFRLEGDSTEWLGRTTAREIGDVLERMHNADLSSATSRNEMISVLRRQFYRSRLPQRLGGDVAVAHKTGDWPPYAGNDVGILYYEGGPTVIAVFTNQNRGDFVELEATLGRIARDIVQEWR